MRNTKIVIVCIIIASFVSSFYFYPQLPERVASHWNAAGAVDGYMSRFWGAFLMPIVISAMAILFLLLPKIDPLKANYEKFRRHFDGFIILIMLFMGYVHGLSIAWNLGSYFNFSFAMLPPMAILFYGVGVLTQNAKRNWFVGIRTPWTLSSDEIWDKTHQLGGKLFKAAAVISLIGLFFGQYGLFFFVIPIFAVSIFTIAYSYYLFRKQNNVKDNV